jgi:hypothetical protein
VLWPVVLWSVVLAGCGSSNEAVEVTAPSPTGVVASQCRHLVDVLPDTVADDEQARDVTPSDAPAAAWGDPPVVLRCGVPKPSAFVPTSACFEVDGVGWLATQDGEEVSGDEPVSGTLTWTTIGRSAYVEVSVPEADGRQPSDPLPALAPAIKQTIPLVHPCQ